MSSFDLRWLIRQHIGLIKSEYRVRINISELKKGTIVQVSYHQLSIDPNKHPLEFYIADLCVEYDQYQRDRVAWVKSDDIIEDNFIEYFGLI